MEKYFEQLINIENLRKDILKEKQKQKLRHYNGRDILGTKEDKEQENCGCI